MTIPGAIYSLQMFVTGGVVILLAKLTRKASPAMHQTS